MGTEGAGLLKYGSLFSGVGGGDKGLGMAGMTCAWQCEIDPFRRRVLAHHWPEVERYDDVRAISATDARGQGRRRQGAVSDRERVTDASEAQRLNPVDLIIGGFPCQDLSVAGKRAGLGGDRSGLWFEFRRVLGEVRPRWCIIENVPGLLSSNGGRDFAVVVAGLGELGYGVAWRVLDSRYFGVPQRRRRVYLVGCLGDPARAAAVLFEPEGGGGDTQAGGAAGKDVAGTLKGGVSGARGWHNGAEEADKLVAAPLGASATSFGGQRYDLDNETYVPEVAYAPKTTEAKQSGSPERGDRNLVSIRMAQTGSNGHGVSEDGTTHTLDGTGGDAVFAIQERAVSEGSSGPDGKGWKQDEAFTLEARNKTQMVAAQSVRRLTPEECEALQAFPRGWTAIEGAKDGPRYAALGDAMTVNVVAWLGSRIMPSPRDSPHGSGPC